MALRLSPSAEAQRKLDAEFKAVAEMGCIRSPAFDLPDVLKSDCANTDPYMDMRETSGAARRSASLGDSPATTIGSKRAAYGPFGDSRLARRKREQSTSFSSDASARLPTSAD
eukprot:601058-Karenia_brevis.AAC.1